MLGNPLARTEELVVQESGDELLIYDLRINKAICLNSTSAKVWHYCDGEADFRKIAKTLYGHLSPDSRENLVLLTLGELDKAGLISGVAENKFASGVSRRQLIRDVGKSSIAALPFVAAVAAPRATRAQSCATVLCGGVCCNAMESCIAGACCPNADVCVGGTVCCMGGQTCSNNICCAAGETGCGASACCTAGETCIAGACCANAQVCAGVCCPGGQMCTNNVCCNAGEIGCGANSCCTGGQICNMGVCV